MARPRKRIELEDSLKIDLNKLRVQSVSQGETIERIIRWDARYWGDTRTIGLLIYRLASATHGSMRLLLRSLDQSIDLVAAPRHFGGVQWYFICPMTGLRASVLWLPPGESCFASRGAWGSQFAYASQFEAPQYRAQSRAHDIRRRLGNEGYVRIFNPPPPSKPKGMHRYTYETLLGRLAFYERKCNLLKSDSHAIIIKLHALIRYDYRNRFRLALVLPGWQWRPTFEGFGSPVRGKRTMSRRNSNCMVWNPEPLSGEGLLNR